jgi:hypothetical protein
MTTLFELPGTKLKRRVAHATRNIASHRAEPVKFWLYRAAIGQLPFLHGTLTDDL